MYSTKILHIMLSQEDINDFVNVMTSMPEVHAEIVQNNSVYSAKSILGVQLIDFDDRDGQDLITRGEITSEHLKKINRWVS